jgi:hypothetical protein
MNLLIWLILWNIIGNYILYMFGALTKKTCDDEDVICQLNVVAATMCLSFFALSVYPLMRVYQSNANVDYWGRRI